MKAMLLISFLLAVAVVALVVVVKLKDKSHYYYYFNTFTLLPTYSSCFVCVFDVCVCFRVSVRWCVQAYDGLLCSICANC